MYVFFMEHCGNIVTGRENICFFLIDGSGPVSLVNPCSLMLRCSQQWRCPAGARMNVYKMVVIVN